MRVEWTTNEANMKIGAYFSPGHSSYSRSLACFVFYQFHASSYIQRITRVQSKLESVHFCSCSLSSSTRHRLCSPPFLFFMQLSLITTLVSHFKTPPLDLLPLDRQYLSPSHASSHLHLLPLSNLQLESIFAHICYLYIFPPRTPKYIFRDI